MAMSDWAWQGPVRPLHHPAYEFAPGCYNLSAWARENDPAPPPRFKLGDRVVLTSVLTVVGIGQDCDGTPLYSLSFDSGAHLEPDPRKYTGKLWSLSEHSFRAATPEEVEADD
jgi:hypothetical protein